MYSLDLTDPRRRIGVSSFGQVPYLRRVYATQIQEVMQFYHRYPKRVDSPHLLGTLLNNIPVRWDLDDYRYVNYVEDAASGVSRNLGLTSPSYRGRLHESGITLGPKTEEVLLSVDAPFELKGFHHDWPHRAPLNYLYHSRTDLDLPVPNNTAPGRGWGVATLNIPMLMLQYRYWLRQQVGLEQPESLFRFLGGYVLPNAVASYLDIAFFNRLARQALGITNKNFPSQHPFYLTDHSKRVQDLHQFLLEQQIPKGQDIEQIFYTLPALVKPRLSEITALPKEPITRNNRWALQLARLPYVKFLVDVSVRHGQGDRSHLNTVYTSLVAALSDNSFNSVGSGRAVQQYNQLLQSLKSQLEALGHGWG